MQIVDRHDMEAVEVGGVSRDTLLFTDSVVAEYLLFRGFTDSFHVLMRESTAFAAARPGAVGAVVDNLFAAAESGDHASLARLWRFVHARFLSACPPALLQELRALEAALYRYMVAKAVERGDRSTAIEFLQQNGDLLMAQAVHHPDASTGADGPSSGAGAGPEPPGSASSLDYSAQGAHGLPDARWGGGGAPAAGAGLDATSWQAWFALPYVRTPHAHPSFAPYFSKPWADALRTSLRNVLAAVLSRAPLPHLLAMDLHRAKMQAMSAALRESEHSRSALQREMQLLSQNIQRMRDDLRDLLRIMYNSLKVPDGQRIRIQGGGDAAAEADGGGEADQGRERERPGATSGGDAPQPAAARRAAALGAVSVRPHAAKEEDRHIAREVRRLVQLMTHPVSRAMLEEEQQGTGGDTDPAAAAGADEDAERHRSGAVETSEPGGA